MAGLEVLFASAAPAISCPQDALICFLHWEVVTNGYYGLGTGDQVRCGAGLGGGESEIRGPEASPDPAELGPRASDAALSRAWSWCQQLVQRMCKPENGKAPRHSPAVAQALLCGSDTETS